MFYIFIALIFYTLTIILSTKANRVINPVIVTAIAHVVSSLIPIIVALSLVKNPENFNPRSGLIYAFLAGTCIAIFALAIGKAYEINKVGIVAPIVFGGSIFLSTVLSYYIFEEKIGVMQGIGLVIIFIGLTFVIYERMYVV